MHLDFVAVAVSELDSAYYDRRVLASAQKVRGDRRGESIPGEPAYRREWPGSSGNLLAATFRRVRVDAKDEQRSRKMAENYREPLTGREGIRKCNRVAQPVHASECSAQRIILAKSTQSSAGRDYQKLHSRV